MTSMGIEWDTTALILINTNDFHEKGIIRSGDGWTITNESYLPKNREQTALDCIANLEVQLGVFRSDNEQMFNLLEFARKWYVFEKEWKTIINNKEIKDNTGKTYPVVTKLTIPDTTNNRIDKDNYKDCATKIQGFNINRYNKLEVYRKNLETVKGLPQITIGIKPQYVIGLYHKLTQLYKEYNKVLPTPGIKSISSVSIIYTNTDEFLKDNDIWKSSERKNELFVFILLCNNFLINIQQRTNSSYMKASFLFKVRTNLRTFLDVCNFNESDMTVINAWYKKIMSNNNSEYIKNYFYQLFEDPNLGYILNKDVLSEYDIYIEQSISSLGIYHINKESELLSLVNQTREPIKEVSYDNTYNVLAPEIILDNNEIKFKNYDDRLNFDIGEWTYDGNIYIEIRGFNIIYEFLYRKIYNQDPIPSGINITLFKDVPSRTKFIFENFLNKIFENTLI